MDENELRKESRRQLWLRTLLFFSAVVALVIGAWHTSTKSLMPFSFDGAREKYECIIVGGGPAGILTATKLAKHLSEGNVLLLESGTDTQSSVVAGLTGSRERMLWDNDYLPLESYDIPLMWNRVAGTRQETPRFSPDRWPINRTLLARAVGGCGLHNAIIYVRSLPNDFARWNQEGWTWENMLPHYQSLERFVDTLWDPPSFWSGKSLADKPWRRTDGPLVTVPAGPKIDFLWCISQFSLDKK